MPEKPSDDVKSRFAARFENDEADEPDGNEQSSKTAKTIQNTKNKNTFNPAKGEKKDQTANIKEDWTNHSVYLPDHLTADLGRQYKYLDLDLDEKFGFSIQKTRHYYPLVVKLGLERLDELESKDIKEEIEALPSLD